MEKYPENFNKIIEAINSRKEKGCIEGQLSRLSEEELQYISEFQENVRKLEIAKKLFNTYQEARSSLIELIEMYKESEGFENSDLHKMLTDVIEEINEIEEMVNSNEPAKMKDEGEKRGIFNNYLIMTDMFLNNINKRNEDKKGNEEKTK